MRDLTLRIPRQIFVEELIEEMTRETWGVLEQTASPQAIRLGSFVTIREALRGYVWGTIQSIAADGDDARVLTIDVGESELEALGLEAAAAVAVMQEDLFTTFPSVLRVARRIGRIVERVIAPYRFNAPVPAGPASDAARRTRPRMSPARQPDLHGAVVAS